MDDDILNAWDKWFLDEKSYKLDINYSPWLEKYTDLISLLKSNYALDLGCGRGFDTQYLLSMGLNVFSADYSSGALNSTRQTVPGAFLLQFDMRDPFPLTDQKFGLIVADLSLHYFSASQTNEIINELQRILVNNGWLIARVNSTNDHGFRSVKDELNKRIEDDYFYYHGIPRKYFSEESIYQFFSGKWRIDHLEEKELMRYEKPKVIWEFSVQKK